MEVLLAGVLFGLSLIVAVGPQNAFVLRQGVARQHVGPVVAVCAASDIALIALGTAGAAVLLARSAVASTVLGAVGVAFLLGYALLAARRACRPGAPQLPDDPSGPSLRTALLACLAFTWLNPAVYLDTVVLVGPVSHAHGTRAWWFAAGAMLASVAWFIALGAGGRALAPVLSRPRAAHVLDAGVAAVMTLAAARLLDTLVHF